MRNANPPHVWGRDTVWKKSPRPIVKGSFLANIWIDDYSFHCFGTLHEWMIELGIIYYNPPSNTHKQRVRGTPAAQVIRVAPLPAFPTLQQQHRSERNETRCSISFDMSEPRSRDFNSFVDFFQRLERKANQIAQGTIRSNDERTIWLNEPAEVELLNNSASAAAEDGICRRRQIRW